MEHCAVRSFSMVLFEYLCSIHYPFQTSLLAISYYITNGTNIGCEYSNSFRNVNRSHFLHSRGHPDPFIYGSKFIHKR